MNDILMLASADQDAFGHYCRLEERREGAGAMFDRALHEALDMLANHPFSRTCVFWRGTHTPPGHFGVGCGCVLQR